MNTSDLLRYFCVKFFTFHSFNKPVRRYIFSLDISLNIRVVRYYFIFCGLIFKAISFNPHKYLNYILVLWITIISLVVFKYYGHSY